jgi:hypothetical protein
MWNGVIDICDGRDLVNVLFQFRHLKKIIAGLKMFSPFKDLHQKDKEDFITIVIWAIGNFLIHEERL